MSFLYKARVPTNIAFLKYWGKSDEQAQWPANDSLSMTLDLFSETSAQLCPPELQISKVGLFKIRGQILQEENPFLKKPMKQLQYLASTLGFNEKLIIDTYNEFPTGCGIASSASGLGSLTLAALACWTRSSSLAELANKGFPLERLALLARMGSGSACRSFWGGFVHWSRGASIQEQNVSPLFAKEHWDLRDCIVILSASEKTISSSIGHGLAKTSPLYAPRLTRLPQRLTQMQEAIRNKNLRLLGPLLEDEALEMHAVMSSSQPPCVYLEEPTHRFLTYLKESRQQNLLEVFFTIDAGPNVHLIYEAKNQAAVLNLVKGYKTIDIGIASGPVLNRTGAQ